MLTGLLVGPSAGAADRWTATEPTSTGDVDSYTGTIDGADYKVAVPQGWNGTLVVFAHGFIPPGMDFGDIWLATNQKTGERLLAEGYALAASQYQGDGTGWQIEGGRDLGKVIDWFHDNIGTPRHTIANGMSMGGQIVVRDAEWHPDRYDGVLAQCADYDTNGVLNASLDMTFAIATLLASDEDIELVSPSDPVASMQKLQAAITKALETPAGRARIALAASLGGLQGWYSGVEPRPTTREEQIRQQARWLHDAYATFIGPLGRPDVEADAGGNPSWNIGIDYRRQFARSHGRELAEWAYEQAGLDLQADLAALNRAPRIAPDLRAVAYMYRYGVASGRTPVPVLSLHSVADSGAIVDQQGWYVDQVRRHGDERKLRSMYIERGGHCAYSAADELVALQILIQRVETGRWPSTDPEVLNDRVAEYGPDYQTVYDFSTGTLMAMPPAFTDYRPERFLRPSPSSVTPACCSQANTVGTNTSSTSEHGAVVREAAPPQR